MSQQYTLVSAPYMYTPDCGGGQKGKPVQIDSALQYNIRVETYRDGSHVIPTDIWVENPYSRQEYRIGLSQADQGEIAGLIKGTRLPRIAPLTTEQGIAEILKRDGRVLIEHDALLLRDTRGYDMAQISQGRR